MKFTSSCCICRGLNFYLILGGGQLLTKDASGTNSPGHVALYQASSLLNFCPYLDTLPSLPAQVEIFACLFCLPTEVRPPMPPMASLFSFSALLLPIPTPLCFFCVRLFIYLVRLQTNRGDLVWRHQSISDELSLKLNDALVVNQWTRITASWTAATHQLSVSPIRVVQSAPVNTEVCFLRTASNN